MKGARFVGKLDPKERVEVTVRLRPRQPGTGTSEAAAFFGTSPASRQYLSRDEFAARYGADPADLQRIEEFAQAYNLEVLDRHPGQRTVRLAHPRSV